MSWDEKSVTKRMTSKPYIFIIVDFLNNKIYDILANRHKNYLTSYFSRIPLETRNKVLYITIDMWDSYLDLAKIYFKNAKIAIDSFHVVKNVSTALDSVRKQIMNKYNNGSDEIEDNHVFYYLLKKYKYILLSEFDNLTDKRFYNRKLKGWYDKHSIRKYILDIDPRLKLAYELYSRYLEFNKTTSFKEASEELEILINDFFDSKLKPFVDVAKTISHWKEYILNSFIKVDSIDGSHKRKLSQNISSIKQSERDNVEYIIIDMWDTYRDIGEIYFKNAKIAVDSFHVIQHLNNAMISIRLKIMRKYDKRTKSLLANDIYYYMIKKFHYFFIKNFDAIYSGPIEIRKMRTKWTKDEIMKYLLDIDDDLKYAYRLKEKYREFNLTTSYDTCDEEFEELIEDFRNSHLEEFREFGRLINKWKPYIKNSFTRINKRRLSNGPMEGINSRIKTIMKAANGYRNFGRLRNRIIYSINKDVPIQGTPKHIK